MGKGIVKIKYASLAVTMLSLLVSCEYQPIHQPKSDGRFQRLYRVNYSIGSLDVICDSKTGVEYLLYSDSVGSAMVKLEPAKQPSTTHH